MCVHREKDDDPYTFSRDATIRELAETNKVKVHVVLGHTLYDAEEIVKKGKGKVPYTYGPFLKILDSLPKPAEPIEAPSQLPDPGPTNLKDWKRADHDVEKWRKRDVNQESRKPSETERDESYESFAGPDGDFGVPTMKELGMEATGHIRGGETEGLRRFKEYMRDEATVANFRKPQTSPAQFDPPASESTLSLASAIKAE